MTPLELTTVEELSSSEILTLVVVRCVDVWSSLSEPAKLLSAENNFVPITTRSPAVALKGRP